MKNPLIPPLDPHLILRKKRFLRRSLSNIPGLLKKRIAILGGSTTAEIKDILELFLLDSGIAPEFYESDYNRYYEDIIFDNEALKAFSPDIVYFHVTSLNIDCFPRIDQTAQDITGLLEEQCSKFYALWETVEQRYQCSIIQNNFELPYYRVLGNLDFSDVHGKTNFILALNQRIAEYARDHNNFFVNDIHYLSSWFGLAKWYEQNYWYAYKYAMNYEAIPLLAHNIAAIVKAIYGKSRKGLVLDLDNTLWGGVIGDVGVEGICLGRETAQAQAYTGFQQYLKELQQRGVILAVCSKNDMDNAQAGLEHPDSVLQGEDFAAIEANWDAKDRNIAKIAASINIGSDGLVFVDDNPAEREIVGAQLPGVAVPDIGGDVIDYIAILDKSAYFETTSVSAEDIERNKFYSGNVRRGHLAARFNNYTDFLKSLEMKAEIRPFVRVYLERITQLANKTNQFNLTTKRYSYSEIECISNAKDYLTLYGKLSDKFGDNGLVSLIIARVEGDELRIDAWLMSCRVLKRGLEYAMLDRLLEESLKHGIKTIHGYYFKTKKNKMVSDFYQEMGFTRISLDEKEDSVWRLAVAQDYHKKNQVIEIIT